MIYDQFGEVVGDHTEKKREMAVILARLAEEGDTAAQKVEFDLVAIVLYVCRRKRTCTCVCLNMYVCMHVCVYVIRMYVCICIYMYVCMCKIHVYTRNLYIHM